MLVHVAPRRGRLVWYAALGALLVLMAHPALAYVKGNYMYHFWTGLSDAIDGNGRAASEIRYGLKQLVYCRGAVERRTAKLEEELPTMAAPEAEAYHRVIAFHRELRIPAANEEEARQERILSMLADGSFAAVRDDFAFVRSLEDAALTLDVEAFFAEERDRDLAKGLARRESAVKAWDAAVDAIRGRAAQTGGAAADAELHRAYLTECATRFGRTASFLRSELELARDPQGLLQRYAFFWQIAYCYSSTGDNQQERIWEILRDTYRGKVQYAIEQARKANGDSPDLARIERQLDPSLAPDAAPKGPELYHLPEMELPFYHYLGTGQEYGGTTAIANELLRHNRRHDSEGGGHSGDHHEPGNGAP